MTLSNDLTSKVMQCNSAQCEGEMVTADYKGEEGVWNKHEIYKCRICGAYIKYYPKAEENIPNMDVNELGIQRVRSNGT